MGELGNRPRPLEGLRIADFSRVVAGPACTRWLADLGAEVIKLEPPEGDLTRKIKPRRAGISIYFSQVNCGKSCICVDLGQAEGRRIARELALSSDVVVENFRPGVMARLGLGPDELRAERPELVYCSISGYGQDGPAAQRRAYAPVVHAEAGLLDLAARARGIDPMPEPVSHADFAVASQATSAVLAALFWRERTGEGQHIDVSMAETMLAHMEWSAIEANGGPGDEVPIVNPARATIVRLADGSHVQLPGNPAATFPTMCRLMGRDDLLEKPGFTTLDERASHIEEIDEIVREWAVSFPDLPAFEAFVGRERVAVGAVKRLGDLPAEDWAVARGAFAPVADGAGGDVLLPFSPLRFSGLDVGVRGRPAYQGEHNREVLARVLGLGAEDLDRLEAAGVLVSRRP
ncbi:MAG: CoA transferase [Acidimicrobiia bacterium]|nr:CoA transferase [Acidimicrobiia bacterium]